MLIVRFLLENGVGQNLTAALIGIALGWVWSRTKFWPLHALHARHDEHHEHLARLGRSLADLHEKLDRIEAGAHPEAMRANYGAISAADAPGAKPPRPCEPRTPAP